MKKIILSALALVALASCSKSHETSFTTTDSEVRISSSIATRTTANTWEKDDEIGVYMTTTAADAGDDYSFANLGTNVKYTNTAADGATATFSSTKPLYYPATDNVDLLAYYPYNDDVNFNITSYPVDVTSQTDQGKIDLMVEEIADQSKTNKAVEMVFDHKLARIALTIEADGGLVADDLAGMTVTLSGTDTEATFDLTKADDASPSPITLSNKVVDLAMITANDAATDSYVVSAEAIIIPQSASATLTFNTVDGNTFSTTISNATFAIGKEYLYTVKIKNTGVTLSSSTINNWDEGDIGKLDATEESAPTGAYKIGDTYPKDGTAIGIVYSITDDTDKDGYGDAGKIMSLEEATDIKWADATAWANDYNAGEKDWHCPSNEELRELYAGYSGFQWIASGTAGEGEIVDWGDSSPMPNNTNYKNARTSFNSKITNCGVSGAVELTQVWYWSSDEYEDNTDKAWCVSFSNGHTYNGNGKSGDNYVRAVFAF